LYLNIFTPYNATNTSKYSVLIFIHGGNFKEGYSGGLLYNGTNFVNYTNSIIVTINYRLGALGFLFSPQAGMMGNYGFYDQKLALHWIYDNIEYFGGDRTKITLFGQSAGAISVALHMTQQSEVDSVLFQSGIMESEPFGLPMRDVTTWDLIGKTFFTNLGCDYQVYVQQDSEKLWQCLRNKTAYQIIHAQVLTEHNVAIEAGHFFDLFMPWTPTFGTDLFSTQPLFLFQQELYRDIPFIIGTVANEAVQFIYQAYPNGLNREQLYASLVLLVGADTTAQILLHYPVPDNVTDYRNYASLVATDGLFKCPTRNISAAHWSNGNLQANIFMYHFNHISSFNVKAWGANYTECDDVVCHGSELPYVFHPNLGPIDSNYTGAENQLALVMQKYWFAMSHNLNPYNGGNSNGLIWQSFNLGNEMSIEFQTDDIVMQSQVDYRESKCAFWDTTGYNWVK